jgi:hypothetical protein
MEIIMDKVKLEYKIPEDRTIEYNGIKIIVKPFLSLVQQTFLINRYIDEYFGNAGKLIGVSDYDYLTAEFSLINYIFQTNTNIETEGLENDIVADSGLWETITHVIVNYKSFRAKLDYIVEDIKAQKLLKNSLGSVISNLADKFLIILEDIKNLNPDEIKDIQNKSVELLKELQESSVIKDASSPQIKAPKKK